MKFDFEQCRRMLETEFGKRHDAYINAIVEKLFVSFLNEFQPWMSIIDDAYDVGDVVKIRLPNPFVSDNDTLPESAQAYADLVVRIREADDWIVQEAFLKLLQSHFEDKHIWFLIDADAFPGIGYLTVCFSEKGV